LGHNHRGFRHFAKVPMMKDILIDIGLGICLGAVIAMVVIFGTQADAFVYAMF
jgi:hypothetical protein